MDLERMAQQTQQVAESGQQITSLSRIHTRLPGILQARIAPLLSLRKSISDYSLDSPRPITSLFMHGHSESENIKLAQTEASQIQLERADVENRYARHGSDLLQIALAESQFRDPQTQELSRQLYINAASFLLQGLPSDLTEGEVLQVRRALPTRIEESGHAEIIRHEPRGPSILHQGVATSIIFLCLLLRLALPYLKYFLAQAYKYERTHHVTKHALAMSMNTADSLGKRGIEIAGVAIDNKLITSTITYCIEGICGGLNEGFGQGMTSVEAKEEP